MELCVPEVDSKTGYVASVSAGGQLADSSAPLVGQQVDVDPSAEAVQQRFLELLEGQDVPVQMGAVAEKPPVWYNEDKFRRGQSFVQRHFAGVAMSHFVGLITSLASAQILKPLIFTQKSETPLKSFRRYVATIVHVSSWYFGNVWEKNNPARKSIQLVRDLHSHVARMTNSPAHHGSVDQMNISNCGTRFFDTNTSFLSNIERDAQPIRDCPFMSKRSDCRVFKSNASKQFHQEKQLYLNQFDMAEIQFYFVSILILNPQKFGAVYFSDEDMSGFVHFWRCIGFLLGIEDRFNFCTNDDVGFTRQLSRFFMDNIAKPSLKHVSIEYEHMGRAIAEGAQNYHPGMSFESLFAYNAFAVDMAVPTLMRHLTWAQSFHYFYLRLVFCWLCWIPGVHQLFSFLIRFSISLMVTPRPKWWPDNWNPPRIDGLAQYWILP